MKFSRNKRVAFIFTNSRDQILFLVKNKETADTSLYGFNHIPGANHFTIGGLTMIGRFIRTLLIIPKLFQYDFIIAQDNLILGYIVSLFSRVFHLKIKWLYLAMNSSTIMKYHANHSVKIFLLKRFWKSYSRIICLSFRQIEDFVQFGISRNKLVFIPFGVDEFFFKPTKISYEQNLIVSVGRDAGRDYETLFMAANQINCPFIVVTSKKNITPNMFIPQNVTVIYDRSLKEIRDLYAKARLVVVVSKDPNIPEGSDCSGQTVILDSLAAKKAVIATRRSWITEYFIPDQDLVVVEPGKPQALASLIISLLNNSRRRKQLAASGYSKVSTYYTTKNFARALNNLMDSVTQE